MNLPNVPLHRSHTVLKPLWELWAWCWPYPAAEDNVLTSHDRLRRFLLLKLVTVLIFPHRAGLSLLLGCPFSIKALLLLRSPHISTKPSTVFLWQLALTDGLLLLHWALALGHRLVIDCLGVGFDNGLIQESFWFKEAVRHFCHHLLDAHLLASLLFLGLLGLEATLVSRWPLQTRAIRTSHWAHLGCTLVWALVLFELLLVVYLKLQTPQSLSFLAVLSIVSFCLRRTLWMCDLWLHYNIIYNKPQKRRSSFH